MLKHTITFAAVAGLVLALAPAAQAQVVLFEEHWVDPLAENNPGWGPTRQEYNWPAPNPADWVPGLDISEYQWGAARWAVNPAAGGTWSSYNLSYLYELGDPRNAGYPKTPEVPTPDGDQWHFAGMHDGGGDVGFHTTPGTCVIPSAARVDTQIDLYFASGSNEATGFQVCAEVGGNWYITDQIGKSPGTGMDTGGWLNGRVHTWTPENVDVENDNWYTLDMSVNPVVIGGAPLSLPAGDITAIGFVMTENGNNDKWAFDDIIVTGVPEPASALLVLLGLPFVMRRKRK